MGEGPTCSPKNIRRQVPAKGSKDRIGAAGRLRKERKGECRSQSPGESACYSPPEGPSRTSGAGWKEAPDQPEVPAGLPSTESPSLVELMRMTREEWDVWREGRRSGDGS